MIRGNYSLAKEVRKNEQKSKQKIQQRQKHQSKLDQLTSIDPIKLFFQIEKLENLHEPDSFQQNRLQKLRQDWEFVKKNKLHEEKVNTFLSNRKQAKEAKEKEQRRLRGKDSVYFNPELNPLGKVPDVNNVNGDFSFFSNIPKPVKYVHVYKADPLISELNIKPPEGSPPRFYKSVQNTSRDSTHNKNLVKDPEPKTKSETDGYEATNLDTDSEGESHSDS